MIRYRINRRQCRYVETQDSFVLIKNRSHGSCPLSRLHTSFCRLYIRDQSYHAWHVYTHTYIYTHICIYMLYIYVHYMYLFRHILGNSSSKINATQLESNQLVAEPLVIVCNRLQQLISHLEDQYAYSAPGCRVTGWARGLEEVLAFMQF